MHDRRHTFVSGEILSTIVLAERGGIPSMETANGPAVLPLLLVVAIQESLPIPLYLGDGKQRVSAFIIRDRGYVVIEQDPLPRAVCTAGQEGLERIVSRYSHVP